MLTRQQIDHILQCLCDMYNQCNIAYAERHFAPDITYDSMWVLTTISGKTTLCFYLETKFKAMKDGGVQPKASIVEDMPAILIRQGDAAVALVVDFKDGRVKHMSLIEPDLLF